MRVIVTAEQAAVVRAMWPGRATLGEIGAACERSGTWARHAGKVLDLPKRAVDRTFLVTAGLKGAAVTSALAKMTPCERAAFKAAKRAEQDAKAIEFDPPLRVPNVAALYGGKRYTDDPRAVAECGGRPWRPPIMHNERSYVGCAAAMTAGVA